MRQLKNTQISEIHKHNEEHLNVENTNADNSHNPYKYIYPDQSYARSKNITMSLLAH